MKTMKSWFGKYKGAENKHSRQIYFIFAGILILIWIFYYILCYYQMPVGDDLLAPVLYGVSTLCRCDRMETVREGRNY